MTFKILSPTNSHVVAGWPLMKMMAKSQEIFSLVKEPLMLIQVYYQSSSYSQLLARSCLSNYSLSTFVYLGEYTSRKD